MERLNEILHELGISKVKLAKFLGVSRQMIYNYLELDDINNWPKDKKVLLLNLLGIKSGDEIKNIKVDTDYILSVESRLNTVLESGYKNVDNSNNDIYSGLSKQNVELLHSVIELLKEKLEDNTNDAYYTVKYLYHTLQAINSSPEIKYMLGYISKASGSVKANEFVFEEEEQFIFESVLF